MARRSLIKAVSAMGRKSRSDTGGPVAAAPPAPAAQLMPASRGAAASSRTAAKPPMPWPTVADSPTKAAALQIAQASASSVGSSAAASSGTPSTPTLQRFDPAGQNGGPAAAGARPPQRQKVPALDLGSPQRLRPDSAGVPASPGQQRPQSGDFELASLRSQLAAVTGALGPAGRGLAPDAAVRRLVAEAAQAQKGRKAAEEQLAVLKEQGDALEQALASQTQLTQRAEAGRQQADGSLKEARQLVEELQQELATAHSDSAGSMHQATQSRAVAAASAAAVSATTSKAPAGSSKQADASTEHMRLELESLRGRVAAADEQLAAAQSAAAFAAQKAPARAMVDHRIAQLEQQLMHAQEACRYAEDRWDDVMGRLTEVLADQAAQQGMPHGPGDGRPRHAEEGLPTVAAVAAAAAQQDAARAADMQREVDALHTELHAAQQAVGVAERRARGLHNELAAVQSAAQAAAAAASRKVQELQNQLAKAQGDQSALQAQVDQEILGRKDANARAAQATASGSAASLRQEVDRLRRQLQEAEAANQQLQQEASAAALGRVTADSVEGTPGSSGDARRRRLFPDRTLNPTFDRQSADVEAEAANNEAHGEGPSAAAQLRKQEVEVAQLQAQLRATQAQVVQLAAWLTSNAQLLMEVGGQHADGSNSDGKIHASKTPLGFHSDQVHLPTPMHGIMSR